MKRTLPYFLVRCASRLHWWCCCIWWSPCCGSASGPGWTSPAATRGEHNNMVTTQWQHNPTLHSFSRRRRTGGPDWCWRTPWPASGRSSHRGWACAPGGPSPGSCRTGRWPPAPPRGGWHRGQTGCSASSRSRLGFLTPPDVSQGKIDPAQIIQMLRGLL